MGRVRGTGDAERWLQWKWREGAIPRPQAVQEGGADVEGNQEFHLEYLKLEVSEMLIRR